MPRTRSIAWAQLRIGLLAVAALVLTAVFILYVGGQAGFGWQVYHLKTRFKDVQGLKTGAVVRVAGVEVGTVRAVEFVGSDVEIVMKVSKGMQDKIRTDSKASIGTLSLLGAPVIDISPGRTGDPIGDWGYVPSQRPYGQLAAVAEGATKSLEEATRLLQDLRAGKGTVGRLFSDDQLYRDISQFVDSAEEVVTALNRGDGTIGKLIKDPTAHQALMTSLNNLSEISTRLNAGEGTLGRLLKDERVAESLSSVASNLDEITGRLKRGEGTAGKLLTEDALYVRLDSLGKRIALLVTRLNEGEGTAGRLLQDEQLYENMNGAASELRALIGEVRKDPRKYLNIKVSLF
jgi:phospholipid/cholesterol/gamma-HCH transport system substrate-binding protein